MAKRTGNVKISAASADKREWLKRKVAELITELEKLPKDRQAELLRMLQERGER